VRKFCAEARQVVAQSDHHQPSIAQQSQAERRPQRRFSRPIDDGVGVLTVITSGNDSNKYFQTHISILDFDF